MSLWPARGGVGAMMGTMGTMLPHCEPQTPFLAWLSTTFNTCVPTPLALVTTTLGSLSFMAWLFAQLPQIYKNYQVRSTTGLSFVFLLVWLLGDTTNLAGAILTRQASWQVLVASYYTFVDCILVFQYAYYTHYLPRQQVLDQPPPPISHHGRRERDDSDVSRRRKSPPRDVRRSQPVAIQHHRRASLRAAEGGDAKSPLGSGSPRSFHGPAGLGREKSQTHRRTHLSAGSAASLGVSPRAVVAICLVLAVLGQAAPTTPALNPPMSMHSRGNHSITHRELIGKIVSWTSTVSYLASRLPQIIKNAQRKSTAGLSITLFIAAFFGNFFYSTSLLTNPLAWGSYPPYGYYGWADAHGSDRHTWVTLALPFWLGAAGVLTLDFTVFMQFIIYGGGAKPFKVVRVPDERGRAPWRSVSGYMRGWVPSPGPDGWRSRLPSLSRETSRAPSLRNVDGEARPLLADNAAELSFESRPDGEPPLTPASASFRPGSPMRPGSPTPMQIARGRPTGTTPISGSPYGASLLSRSYGAT